MRFIEALMPRKREEKRRRIAVQDMTERAKKMMTGAQKESSAWRDTEHAWEKDQNFEGKIHEAQFQFYGPHREYQRNGWGKMTFNGELNQHKISGSFNALSCPEGCCVESFLDSAKLEVDGKPLSTEAAEKFAERHFDLIHASYKRTLWDKKAPASIDAAMKKHLAEQESLRREREELEKESRLRAAQVQELIEKSDRAQEELKKALG
jgi:hypothetical protein